MHHGILMGYLQEKTLSYGGLAWERAGVSGYLGRLIISLCDRHRPFDFHHNQPILIMIQNYTHLNYGYINLINLIISSPRFFPMFSLLANGLYPAHSSLYTLNSDQILKPCCLESEKLILMLDVLSPQMQLRTFVFEQQETQQSLIVDCQLDLTPNFINLNNLLTRHCALQEHRVSIYDPNSNSFASLSKIGAESGYIHRQYLEPTIILIRYKRRQGNMHDEAIDSSSSMEQESSGERRQGRSKERTIAETIEVVKRWRDLHLYTLNSKRRKMNLQEAAKMVGVSKKSLDDYYCQLRLGEFYGFDFAANLHEGIGVLRTFVKENREKPSQKIRNRRQNQKYPKNLRVIDQFEVATKTLFIEDEPERPLEEVRQESMMELPPMGRFASEQELRLPEQPYQYEQDSLQLFRELSNLEHDFFQGFQLDLAGSRDPYRQIAYDFSRKGCDLFEQGNSFLYLDN